MEARAAVGELTSDDKEIIKEVRAILESKDAGRIDEAIDDLCFCSPDVLYAVTMHSSEISKLCQDKKFNERLVECPSYGLFLPKENIVSVADDKGDVVTVTPFQQHMGLYLFQEAKKSGNADLLNRACEFGSYHALCHRMDCALKFIQDAPKNSKEKLSEVDKKIEQLYEDAVLIGSLYRSLGYFKAAITLLNAAVAYLDFFKLKEVQREISLPVESTSETKMIGITRPAAAKLPPIVVKRDGLLERALINFYLSFASSETASSVEINFRINEGKNLLEGFEKLFASWEEGDKFLKEKLPNLTEFPRALFSNVRLAVGKQISEHPEDYKKLSL